MRSKLVPKQVWRNAQGRQGPRESSSINKSGCVHNRPAWLFTYVHVSSREILVDHCRPLGSLLECEHKCISLGAWNALCEDPRVYNDILWYLRFPTLIHIRFYWIQTLALAYAPYWAWCDPSLSPSRFEGMPRDAKVQERVHLYTKVGVFTIDLPDCLRMSMYLQERF